MSYTIKYHDRVVLARLDRPEVLNALNAQLLEGLVSELNALDASEDVGCIVVTGSDRAFTVGADISEMEGLDHLRAFHQDFLAGWDQLAQLRTPTVAAVAGYALGGGCELAMACDLVLADETARFGQPEITLGLIPGMGGTQRLIRAVGKSLAMDMILTGRTIDASEALGAGLVARVVDAGTVVEAALEVATTIASFSKTAAMMATEAVNRAHETSLAEGLLFERRSYQAIFSLPAAAEGIGAFNTKRKPQFTR